MTALLLSSSVRADNEQQLREVRARLDQLMSSLSADQQRQGQLQQEITAIEKQLNRLNRQLNSLDQDMQSQRARIQQLQQDKRAAQQALAEQESSLADQLRAAYMLGTREQLQLLLNQQTPAELSRMLTYYEYIGQARVAVIHRSRDSIIAINQLEQQIHSRNTELAELDADYQQQRSRYLDRQAQRQRLLQDVIDTIANTDAEITQLKNDERRLQRLVEGLQQVLDDIPPELDQQPFKTLKGQLLWPVNGRLQNRFGQRRPASDLRWNGVRLTAAQGTQVQAVSYGRVAFADWMAGYGLLVVIDHRDGYMSLYAHNQQLNVDVGDWINAGEPIASVGNTGGQTQNGLYFELRHQGKPINPVAWCQKR